MNDSVSAVSLNFNVDTSSELSAFRHPQALLIMCGNKEHSNMHTGDARDKS